MPGGTERFIVRAQPKGALPYHDTTTTHELGPSYHCMNSSLVAGADIYVDVNQIKQVPTDFTSAVAEPHRHPVSKVYTIIDDLTVEVSLDGEKHEVSGPAAVFVPAGMRHTLRPLRGSGYVVVTMTGGEFKATG